MYSCSPAGRVVVVRDTLGDIGRLARLTFNTGHITEIHKVPNLPGNVCVVEFIVPGDPCRIVREQVERYELSNLLAWELPTLESAHDIVRAYTEPITEGAIQ